jgi:hypothetical protein
MERFSPQAFVRHDARKDYVFLFLQHKLCKTYSIGLKLKPDVIWCIHDTWCVYTSGISNIYIYHMMWRLCVNYQLCLLYKYIHIWLQMSLNIVLVWSKSVRIFERARRSLALSVDHGVSQTQRTSMAWFKVQVQVRGDHCGFTTFYPKTAWVSWVSCTLSLNIPKNPCRNPACWRIVRL